MSDERIIQSVADLKLFISRGKEATRRNRQKRCDCQVGSPTHPVHIGGKKVVALIGQAWNQNLTTEY